MKGNARKWISLTLAGALAAAALTGCGTEKREQASGRPELSVFGWEYEKAAQSENDYIYQQIQEKVGVDLKPVNSSKNNWEERLGVLIASGDVPDIFVNKGLENKENYNKWMKEGLLLPISDYATADQYPLVAKQLKSFEDLTKLQDGKHYSLPIASDLSPDASNVASGHTIYIRKDWMEKLGLSEPATIDEFYQMAKAFRENDPNGSGKQDTYGFAAVGIWWLYPVFNAFNTSFERYYKEGGEWKPECISENMLEAVTFLKKCYDEKLLDPDFMSLTDDKKIENFVAGRDGIIFHNGGEHYNIIYNQFKSAYPDKDPKDMFTYLTEPLAGPDGTERIDGGLAYWAATAIRGDIEENKRGKALELLEFMCSPEGSKLCSLGEPGVDYKEEGGRYISLLPESEMGTPLTLGEKNNSANFLHMVGWSDTSYTASNAQNYEEVLESTKAFNKAAVVDPLLLVSVSDKVDSAEIKQLKDAVYEGLAKLITQSADLERDFKTYTENWKSVGGDNYTQALNGEAPKMGL